MASWKPNNDGNTCGCELTVTSGGVLGDKATPHTFLTQCSEHAGMTASEVRDENLRASKVMNHLLASAPASAVDEVMEDGGVVRRWKDGHEPLRTFDASRTMTVKLSSAWTLAQRAGVQPTIDERVGAGRTRLV